MRSRVNKPVNSAVNEDKMPGHSTLTAGKTHLSVTSTPRGVRPVPARNRSNALRLVTLCVVHLLIAVAIGLHNEWSWSEELLRIVTNLPYTVA